MTLLEKLLEISKEIGSLSKSATNSAFKYKYVKGEVAMSAFRDLEAKHRIKVLASVLAPTIQVMYKEGSGFITTMVIKYEIHDLDSKDRVESYIPAQGYDTTDKGVYKAMTGGFKYFILQNFSASSDDPEKEPMAKSTPQVSGVSGGQATSLKPYLPNLIKSTKTGGK